MPVGFYMDVHIPRSITDQLRRRGIDVLTSIEDRSNALDDATLLDRATQLSRVLVTTDIRFRDLAQSWQDSGRLFSGLVFAHQLRITIGQFVRDLELIAMASLDGECDSQIFRLPL